MAAPVIVDEASFAPTGQSHDGAAGVSRREVHPAGKGGYRPAGTRLRTALPGRGLPLAIQWGRFLPEHTTHPGSRLLFPALCQPTGQPPTPTPAANQPGGERTLMMPTRKHTRTQNRTRRINTERALNAAHVAERNQPPPF